jgi:hypothetical protein
LVFGLGYERIDKSKTNRFLSSGMDNKRATVALTRGKDLTIAIGDMDGLVRGEHNDIERFIRRNPDQAHPDGLYKQVMEDLKAEGAIFDIMPGNCLEDFKSLNSMALRDMEERTGIRL